MENLQTEQVTIDDTSANTVVTAENNTTEQVEVTPKTFTEEEYNKAIQSASSKAKFDILKELGINSVKEFKDLQTTYNNAIQEKETLNNKTQELENELAKIKLDNKITSLGIAEEYKDDFMELAEVKMTKTSKSFDEVSKEILEKNQHWIKTNSIEKLGTDRQTDKSQPDGVSDNLKEKFPWLK